MRYPLSTYTDGSFIHINTSASTLVHTEASDVGTKYIRIIGFNRGRKSRNISFQFNDTNAVFVTVQPTGNPQILIPDIPIYNHSNTLNIHTSLRQSSDAWNIPDNMSDLIVLNQGQVIGITASSVTADVSAQPILLHIQDSRRTDTDIDHLKGSESIIELYQTNGIIALDIIEPGQNLVYGNLRVFPNSGVYIYGDIFVD